MPLIFWPLVALVLTLGLSIYLLMPLFKKTVPVEGAPTVSLPDHKPIIVLVRGKIINVIIVGVLVSVWLLNYMKPLSWSAILMFWIGTAVIIGASLLSLVLANLIGLYNAKQQAANKENGGRIIFGLAGASGLVISALTLLIVWLIYKFTNNFNTVYFLILGSTLSALILKLSSAFLKTTTANALAAGYTDPDLMLAEQVSARTKGSLGWLPDWLDQYLTILILAVSIGLMFMPLFSTRAPLLPLFLAAAGLILSAIIVTSGRYFKINIEKVLTFNFWAALIILIVIEFFMIKFIINDGDVFKSILIVLIASIIAGLLMLLQNYKKNNLAIWATKNKDYFIGYAIKSLVIGLVLALPLLIIILLTLGLVHKTAGLYGLILGITAVLSAAPLVLTNIIFKGAATTNTIITDRLELGTEIKEATHALAGATKKFQEIIGGFNLLIILLTGLIILTYISKIITLSVITLVNVKIFVALIIGGLMPIAIIILTLVLIGQANKKLMANQTAISSQSIDQSYQPTIKPITSSINRSVFIIVIITLIVPIIVSHYLNQQGLVVFLWSLVATGFPLILIASYSGASLENIGQNLMKIGLTEQDNKYDATLSNLLGEQLKITITAVLSLTIKLTIIFTLIAWPILFR